MANYFTLYPDTSLQEAAQNGTSPTPEKTQVPPEKDAGATGKTPASFSQNTRMYSPAAQDPVENRSAELQRKAGEASGAAEAQKAGIADYLRRNPGDTVAEAYEKMAYEQDEQARKARKAYEARAKMAGLADFIGVLSRLHAATQNARIDPMKSLLGELTDSTGKVLEAYRKAADRYRGQAAEARAKGAAEQEGRGYSFRLNQYNQALKEAARAADAAADWDARVAGAGLARREKDWEARVLPVETWDDPGQRRMRREQQDEAVRTAARTASARAGAYAARGGRSSASSGSGGGGMEDADILLRKDTNHAPGGQILIPRTQAADNALMAAARWALKQYPKFNPGRLAGKDKDRTDEYGNKTGAGY